MQYSAVWQLGDNLGTVLLYPLLICAEGTPKLFTIHVSLFTKKDGYSPSFLHCVPSCFIS